MARKITQRRSWEFTTLSWYSRWLYQELKKGKKKSNKVIQIQDYIDKKVDTQLSQNVDEMIMLFINKLASQGIDVTSSVVQKDILFIIKFIDALY